MRRLLNFALLLCALPVHAQYSVQKFDIHTGSGSSNPVAITDFSSKAYMVANDGINGSQLWWCDGISYAMVDNQTVYKTVRQPREHFGILNGRLYYDAMDVISGDRRIFWYDGVHDAQQLPFNDSAVHTGISYPYVGLNGRLYFSNGSLWQHYPLTNAFLEISGVMPGTHINSAENKMIAYNGKLMVSGSTGTANDGLFECDLHVNSALNLTNVYQAYYDPHAFNVYMNRMFFVAQDEDFGKELYMYNGVDLPQRITDILPGNASTFSNNTYASYFGFFKNAVYFFVNNSGTTKMYKYDISTDHVSMVWDAGTFVNPAHDFAAYGGNLYFNFTHPSTYETMYVYDGVSDPHPFFIPGQFTPTYPNDLTVSNGRLFFSGYDSTGDRELYALTDTVALSVNTPGGVLAANVYPNPASTTVHIDFTLKNPADAEVQLTDMQGKIVYRSGIQHFSAAAHDIEIPVHDCAVGNYIYSVTDGGGHVLYTGKVVKE